MLFIPMSKEEMDQHEIDLTDARTKRAFESRGSIWDEQSVPEFVRNRPWKDRKDIISQFCIAQKICGRIRYDFLGVKRRRGSGNEQSVTLAKFTDWRSGSFKDSLLEDEFIADVMDVYNSRVAPFEARNGLPHAMVLLAMCYPPEENALQRHELLTILAITISQLKKPSLRAHSAIPIKTLSFCGSHGRILEAYYRDGLQRLIVKTSRFYDFSTEEEGLPNADLFLRHMACRLEGETWNLH